MSTTRLKIRSRIWCLFVSLFFIISCKEVAPSPSPAEVKESKDQIKQMAMLIETDISKNGPAAWLNYFEDTPDFFMASNGDLVFKNHQTAHEFILNTLIKSIPKISLKWKNVSVDPYNSEWGSIGADFHEDLTYSSGKTISVDGYFTASAHKTADGWKLRNAHWSIKPAA